MKVKTLLLSFASILISLASVGLAETHVSQTYHVAKDGKDGNPGTLELPFASLKKAASVCRPGDTCLIREGTYFEVLKPQHSGKSTRPIVFESYPGEAVIISAMEPVVDTWKHVSGDLYKTEISNDLGQENMILADGRLCDLARWPNNTDGNPYTLDALRNSGGSEAEVKENAFLEYAEGIPDIDWTEGGYLYFFGDSKGSGWLSWRSWIQKNSTTQVDFKLPSSWIGTYHAPADGGEFFLQGAFGALDYPYEWYLDRDEQTLYLQLPKGQTPDSTEISVRSRKIGIDLEDRSHIEIRNLAVVGGSIEITGSASHNILYGVSSFYGSYTSGVEDSHISNCQSVNILGDHNTIERCEIAYGTGTGLFVTGSHNKILNSHIHDFGFLGNYDAPVVLRKNGEHTKLIGNTIYHGGRDGIQFFHKYSEVAYNDVSQTNLIAHDCAPIYTLGGPFYSEIHHNWFHDVYCRGKLYKGAGLYLDNSSQSHKVHHNVVWNTQWSSLQINWNAKDLEIYNNTFWNGSQVMDFWRPIAGEFPGIEKDTVFENVKVWNNLSNEGTWDTETDLQNNLTLTSDPFVDSANGDFRLKTGTSPIDAGLEIAEITDGFQGAAPDVGAYESGEDKGWRAGIDWDPATGPAGHGDYGVIKNSN